MGKTIAQIRNEWLQIHNELAKIEKNSNRDINLVRRAVREKILREQKINSKNQLEVLLQKEYELEKEENKLSFTLDLISKGKNPKSPRFDHELNKLLIQNELGSMGYQKHQLDDHRKTIQEKVILGEEIPKADIAGKLLAKEIMHERELERISIEENALKGFDRNSPAFQNFVDLRMMMQDQMKLDPERLKYYENEFKDKKSRNEEIDLGNGYFRFLQKESDLNARIEAAAKEAKQKEQQEKIRQEELNRKAAENEKKEAEILVEATQEAVKEAVTENPSVGLFARFINLFRRTPKEVPVVTEPVKTEVKEETKKEETKEKETEKENLTQETSVKEKEMDEETKKQQEIEAQNKLLEEEREKEEKKKREEEKQKEEKKKREEEQAHRYRVEFAGKELRPEIQGCSDPVKLKEYLEDATLIKNPEAREHVQARILANAKIQSYESSRSILQKNRPPAVKYKDGTILLKNKKKDVPKQTSMNGCWSAVLSDMLGHFGVDLSQEEIRAYRPDLSIDMNKDDAKKLMERLSNDSMNEINDMADLIQRTVPNVAHHHLTLGASVEGNKAVLKEKVIDALLNKNSPVALLYGNHYLSVVGIKGDTLIVQNPDPRYETKYQKLSINDLFEGCKNEKGEGSVVIDWLEDLSFKKDGTCKNMNEQWKNMGIECNKREFKAGEDKNEFTHVIGNQYFDTSRITEEIEETVYLPKMSFGREKDLALVEVKQQQMKNVKDGIMTMEQIQKHENKLVSDETEIANDENELTLDELNRNTL